MLVHCDNTMEVENTNEETREEPTKGKEKENWAQSKAKAILRTGLLNGTIKPDKDPRDVFNLNPSTHGK